MVMVMSLWSTFLSFISRHNLLVVSDRLHWKKSVYFPKHFTYSGWIRRHVVWTRSELQLAISLIWLVVRIVAFDDHILTNEIASCSSLRVQTKYLMTLSISRMYSWVCRLINNNDFHPETIRATEQCPSFDSYRIVGGPGLERREK